jgi:hypothetical protein
MKKSISRATLCRQRDLHEVSIGVSGGSAPVATGLDKAFIQSITRESEGLYNILCKDRAQRDLVPVLLSMSDASTLANFVSADEESIKIQSRTLVAIAAVKATKVIQDLTFLADTAGNAGNSITVRFTTGGTAGSELVTVVGSAITVQIASGVSTATQVKAAIDGSVAAAALVDTSISGTAGTAQVAVAATALAGGHDAWVAGDPVDASYNFKFLWHQAAHVY